MQTAGSEFALSPSRSLMAAATTVVRSSTPTTASSGRRRANVAIVSALAPGSAKSSVTRESGARGSNVLGRSEAHTSSTPSLPAAATKASVRYVVVGRRSSRRPADGDTDVTPSRRGVGLCFAGGVVGVRSGGVIGRVEDFGDFRDLFLAQPLDALLQRDVRRPAALATATHLEVDPVVLHVDELDEAAMSRDRRVDHRIDQLLNFCPQIFAHARTSQMDTVPG